ncbi:hypothetical protein D9M69_563170 [compost metagenome]
MAAASTEDDDRIDTTRRDQLPQEGLPFHHWLGEVQNVSAAVVEIVAAVEVDLGDLNSAGGKQVAQA